MLIRSFIDLTLRAVLTCAAVILVTTSAFAEPRAITFHDLPDPMAQTFEDPFKKMGLDMLEELRTVVRLEERLETDEVSTEVRPRLEAQLIAARSVLEANGHDIERLLSQRWIIADNRRRAKVAINKSLSGEDVSLSGFLIPGGTDENGKRVGFLVAQVGMCSHIPPPPPNQLVRVTLPKNLPNTSLYEPVTIAGTLRPKQFDTTVFLLDGEVRMIGMWGLELQNLTKIRPNKDPVTSSVMQRRFRASLGRTVITPD